MTFSASERHSTSGETHEPKIIQRSVCHSWRRLPSSRLVFAQDAAKPVPGANLQYVGANTRISVGIDSGNNARGEIFRCCRATTSQPRWPSSGPAAIRRRQALAPLDVRRRCGQQMFAAYDRVTVICAKRRWAAAGNTNAGSGTLTPAKVCRVPPQLDQQCGKPLSPKPAAKPGAHTPAGDTITTVTTRSFTRAYDWGVGGRVGHFYEAAPRVTAGLTMNGAYSSKQWTGTLMARSSGRGSPISIVLSGEIPAKPVTSKAPANDQRGMLMLRANLAHRSRTCLEQGCSRMVTATERVPDPELKPPVAAAALLTLLRLPAPPPNRWQETRHPP